MSTQSPGPGGAGHIRERELVASSDHESFGMHDQKP